MQITFDTNSAEDVKQVKAFLRMSEDAVAAEPEAEPAPAPKPAAKKAAPAAKKAAAKPEPDPEPEEAEEATDEAEEADEDLLGTDEEPTMADAVARATELVSGGEAARVKAVLADHGVKRVSELKGDAIGTFVRALAD